MTYDLRQLCLHSLIERWPQNHSYRVTALGFLVALFLTRSNTRLLCPSLVTLGPQEPPASLPLRQSFNLGWTSRRGMPSRSPHKLRLNLPRF